MSTIQSPAGNLPPSPPSDWMNDAPTGDTLFSDLWPSETLDATPAPATPEPAPDGQPQAVSTPTEAKPFIKTSTGTVYNTIEDAIAGTEHKDQYIENLRKEIEALKGTAPQSTQPTSVTPQAPPDPEAEQRKVAEVYYKKLTDAVSKQDPVSFMQAMQEMQMANLAPYASVMNDLVKQRAFNEVSQEVRDFNDFRRSPQYGEVLERFPRLKQAIELSESRIELAGQLPELYQLAYWSAQGRRVPELIKQTSSTNPKPTTAVRPTTTSSTPTITAAPVGPQTTSERLASIAGRKEIIANGDALNMQEKILQMFGGGGRPSE